jgi:hypothetical protein
VALGEGVCKWEQFKKVPDLGSLSKFQSKRYLLSLSGNWKNWTHSEKNGRLGIKEGGKLDSSGNNFPFKKRD